MLLWLVAEVDLELQMDHNMKQVAAAVLVVLELIYQD